MDIKNREEVERIIKSVVQSLSPDLLKGQYKNPQKNLHPTTGHCYAASEACYYLLDGKKNNLKACVAKDGNETHWWLQAPDGQIIDPTKEQYTSLRIDPPYQNGKGCGFLTKAPSKRASIIMAKAFKILDEEKNNTCKVKFK